VRSLDGLEGPAPPYGDEERLDIAPIRIIGLSGCSDHGRRPAAGNADTGAGLPQLCVAGVDTEGETKSSPAAASTEKELLQIWGPLMDAGVVSPYSRDWMLKDYVRRWFEIEVIGSIYYSTSGFYPFASTKGVFVLSNDRDFIQLISYSAERAAAILGGDVQGEGPWRYRGKGYDVHGVDELQEWLEKQEAMAANIGSGSNEFIIRSVSDEFIYTF
jgi:hypothetical protein